MTFNAKSILNELAWLAFSFLLSIAVVWLFCEWNIENRLIRIRILETRVVFPDSILIFLLWMLMTFIFFILKELLGNRKNDAGKLMGIIAGLIFIILINFLPAGWTSYPPLESLGEKQFTRENYNHGLFMLAVFALILMVVFIIWWVYKWRKVVR